MKKTLVIHPFLFAIYPIFFLFSHNVNEFPANVIYMPLTIVLGFTLLSWYLMSFILKDKKKAGLLVSIFLLLFFSYGHFKGLLAQINFILWYVGTNIALLSICSIILFFGVFFVIRTRRNLDNFTKLLNIMAASLVMVSLINIGIYKFKAVPTVHESKNAEDIKINLTATEYKKLPNIYYIILDSYARADILSEMYHFDNTDFLDYLKQKGFYVGSKSSSNHQSTALSLTTSLNFNYIQNLLAQINVDSNNLDPLVNMLKNNRVFNFLKQYGYKIVVFSSGARYTEIKDVDI